MRVVDLFAGGGGSSEGAVAAGADVVFAANHNSEAVSVHAARMPGIQHVCQDLHQIDWARVPGHDLMLASPECQGQSAASQPRRLVRHKASRATAWAVISCVEYHRPRFALVENTSLFYQWSLYPVWREALSVLGYTVEEHTFDAAEFGVPQNRKRVFILATRGKGSIRLKSPKLDTLAFGECINWGAGEWRPRTQAAAGAQSRMNKGDRLGARFITQHVTNHPGRKLSRPIGTITTKDQWGVVDGDRYRPLTLDEYRQGMGFERGPLGRTRGSSIKLLGNAVPPPMMRVLVRQIMEAV